jgi:hypothetical protein
MYFMNHHKMELAFPSLIRNDPQGFSLSSQGERIKALRAAEKSHPPDGEARKSTYLFIKWQEPVKNLERRRGKHFKMRYADK